MQECQDSKDHLHLCVAAHQILHIVALVMGSADDCSSLQLLCHMTDVLAHSVCAESEEAGGYPSDAVSSSESQCMLLRYSYLPGSSLPFCTSILYSACSRPDTDNDEGEMHMQDHCKDVMVPHSCFLSEACKCASSACADANINRICWARCCRRSQHAAEAQQLGFLNTGTNINRTWPGVHMQRQHLCPDQVRPAKGTDEARQADRYMQIRPARLAEPL